MMDYSASQGLVSPDSGSNTPAVTNGNLHNISDLRPGALSQVPNGSSLVPSLQARAPIDPLAPNHVSAVFTPAGPGSTGVLSLQATGMPLPLGQRSSEVRPHASLHSHVSLTHTEYAAQLSVPGPHTSVSPTLNNASVNSLSSLSLEWSPSPSPVDSEALSADSSRISQGQAIDPSIADIFDAFFETSIDHGSVGSDRHASSALQSSSRSRTANAMLTEEDVDADTLTQTRIQAHISSPIGTAQQHTPYTRAQDNVGTRSVRPGEATRANTSAAPTWVATNGRAFTPDSINHNNNQSPATGHPDMANFNMRLKRRSSAPSAAANTAHHSPVLVPNSQPDSGPSPIPSETKSGPPQQVAINGVLSPPVPAERQVSFSPTPKSHGPPQVVLNGAPQVPPPAPAERLGSSSSSGPTTQRDNSPLLQQGNNGAPQAPPPAAQGNNGAPQAPPPGVSRTVKPKPSYAQV
jgi:hypothetical protein